MVLRLRNKEIGFEDLVMSEEYFLTALDYVLLNIYYKLPIVMISLKEYRMNNSKNIFMLNTSEKGNYYFIKQGAVKKNRPQQMSILFTDDTFVINKRFLKPDLLNEVELEEVKFDLIERLIESLDTYQPKPKKKTKKIKLNVVKTLK